MFEGTTCMKRDRHTRGCGLLGTDASVLRTDKVCLSDTSGDVPLLILDNLQLVARELWGVHEGPL